MCTLLLCALDVTGTGGPVKSNDATVFVHSACTLIVRSRRRAWQERWLTATCGARWRPRGRAS
eukprot:998934-Prorocentrum_minimum.AAC.2